MNRSIITLSAASGGLGSAAPMSIRTTKPNVVIIFKRNPYNYHFK